MTTQEEFFQKHAVDGVLPENRMAELLTLSAEGESGGSTSQSGEPVPTPAPTAAPAAGADGKANEEVKDGADTGTEGATGATPDPATLNADNAVILARDGKHTISYSELERARERARAAEDKAAADAAELARLRGELEGRGPQTTATGETTVPAGTQTPAGGEAADPAKLLQGVDFGDYSDAAIAKAVVQLVDKKVADALPAITAAAQGPAKEREALSQAQEHYTAIYTAVPDADSIAESQEFSAWLKAQPSYAQKAINATLAEGSAQDVVEVFTSYKQATGKTGAAGAGEAGKPGSAAETAAAAAAAIAKATTKTPSSLSEIPAGTAAHHDEAEAMLTKTSTQLMASFEGMDPAQIMAKLNKAL